MRLRARYDLHWLTVLAGALALLVVAVGLIPQMNAFSLWYDEVRVIEGAQSLHAPADLFRWQDEPARIVHPPLFFVLLKGWMAAAGQTDFALRVLPALLTILAAAFVYRLGQDFSSGRVMGGVAAAVIFGHIGFITYFTHMVHNYSLLLLFSAALLFFYCRWWWLPSRPRPPASTSSPVPFSIGEGEIPVARGASPLSARRGDLGVRSGAGFRVRFGAGFRVRYAAGVVLSTVLLLYTHYYSAFLIVVLNGYVLVWWMMSQVMRDTIEPEGEAPLRPYIDRARLASWVGLQALALALYLPWLPEVYHLATGGFEESSEYVGVVFTSSPDVTALLEKALNRWFYDGVWAYAALLGVGVGAAVVAAYWRAGRDAKPPIRWRDVVFLVVVIVGVVVVALMVNTVVQSFRPRRILYVLIPAALLLGTLLATLRRPVVVAGLLAVFLVFTSDRPPSAGLAGNWYFREAVQHVAAHAAPTDAVYINYGGWFEYYPFRHYAGQLLPQDLPHFMPDADYAALTYTLWARDRLWVIWPEGHPWNWPELLDGKQYVERARDQVGGHNISLYETGVPTREMPPDAATNPEALPLPQTFGTLFALTGYAVESLAVAPGDTLTLWLDWLPQQRTDREWEVYVHLLAEDSAIWGQADGPPLHRGYPLPTLFWIPGVPVYDAHTLTIQPDTPPGVYTLRIGMYAYVGGERLLISPGDGAVPSDGLVVARVTVR